uniref:Reverse transcriptase domain-containing protein n=1 Tax=Cajanus cajan TaxID=3821 RepID=A0A151RGS4_CAJCA|nr:hypothetical protein KK1_036945 [Cajanus cajan]
MRRMDNTKAIFELFTLQLQHSDVLEDYLLDFPITMKPELNVLSHTYIRKFYYPLGLPPHRSQDNYIHLILGSKLVNINIDSLLVCSYVTLEVVLQLLKNHKLFAKLSKCVFGLQEIDYLGHTILGKGVTMDQGKVQTILEWPIPLMGLDGHIPISLVGSLYKILAKLLSNRLKKVLSNVIDNSQSAFLSGGNLLHIVLCANEVIDDVKRKKK